MRPLRARNGSTGAVAGRPPRRGETDRGIRAVRDPRRSAGRPGRGRGQPALRPDRPAPASSEARASGAHLGGRAGVPEDQLAGSVRGLHDTSRSAGNRPTGCRTCATGARFHPGWRPCRARMCTPLTPTPELCARRTERARRTRWRWLVLRRPSTESPARRTERARGIGEAASGLRRSRPRCVQRTGPTGLGRAPPGGRN